jgi:hypothetical protein
MPTIKIFPTHITIELLRGRSVTVHHASGPPELVHTLACAYEAVGGTHSAMRSFSNFVEMEGTLESVLTDEVVEAADESQDGYVQTGEGCVRITFRGAGYMITALLEAIYWVCVANRRCATTVLRGLADMAELGPQKALAKLEAEHGPVSVQAPVFMSKGGDA